MTEEHEQYLDDLRVSGTINMFSAVPYLEHMFDMDKEEAKSVLIEWMESRKNARNSQTQK